MNPEQLEQFYQHILVTLGHADTYIQLAIIAIVYTTAFGIGAQIKSSFRYVNQTPPEGAHPVRSLLYRIDKIIAPALAILLMKVALELSQGYLVHTWVLAFALSVALLLFVNSLIERCVHHPVLRSLFKWIGLPILFLHLIGLLDDIIAILQDINMEVGNISISAYGLVRVLIFGIFLFWFGRASNAFGQDIIRKQESFDIRTREVIAKIFEVALFCIVFLLLLNVMGINLTALTVFGGALGVGLGFGLQAIASNFISGIIILLDRSITVGDYIEMEDGQKGFVREFKMRYTTLETYDGKDIMVPNEKLITTTFVNWSHKDPKQRYRVDFSVAYKTDIRSMVDMIKEVVAQHPQVISGDDIPFEERPDCEIDSFGDSGVNMFVEFWMYGIDDGKNRVGGDLLLMIFEALREHNIEIPFPQREVRVLNPDELQKPGDAT